MAPSWIPETRDHATIVLLGHGSREPGANHDLELLAQELRERWSGHPIVPAYVELAQPSLGAALVHAASIGECAVVQPCFLFAAGHVKNDLPLELSRARTQFPHVEFIAANALGAHPAMVRAALDRLGFAPAVDRMRKAVLVVGRGSSDPDANSEFARVVRLIGEATGIPWTLPAFIGITHPTVEEALELLARSRPAEIAVLPYFLFAGRLIAQLQEKLGSFAERYGWIKTHLAPHLGLHQGLLDALDQRLREALYGNDSLPCDNCQYRVPISPIVNNVGGLRALLWSVRHTTTHGQAMPHIHAHRTMRRHVLVCGNVDCAARGSVPLIGMLRRLIKAAGEERHIRVTKTACMGRCGEGPTVAVYPDGIWYRGVSVDDAAELVEEHLLKDKLVARLVDAIMQ